MLPRPAVEKMLDHALRPGRSGMVVLRGPRGAGRGTAVRLWSRRLADDGRVVVRVDVGSGDTVDGAALATAIRDRLASNTLDAPGVEELAAALDAREVVLVVDRLGPESADALVFLDRLARRLRRGRVVALTAMPLPGPEPTFDAWAPLVQAPRPAREPAHVELTLRDLAVRAGEAQAAASALDVPLSRTQARLLVTATAGWPGVLFPVLAEIARASAAGDAVTDDLVASVAAARRAAFLRAALPEEAISVVVEASLAPRFSRTELAATGLLAAVPGADTFVDRLVETGLLLDDPASPDDVLAVEPHARRAVLDYARGRDRDELHLRATKAARRKEQAHDARGALLVALEADDAGLVRDLLHGLWAGVLDGRDPTLHEALWSAVSAAPAQHVPPELRTLLSVTRRSPGLAGAPEPPARPADQPGAPAPSLTVFGAAARLRRAGRADDALRLARGWLRTPGSAPAVARVLVGLQAALAATEAGQLHEALRHAETAHHDALGCGTLPLAAAAAELVALVHALDSNVHTAGDWSAEAEALPDPPVWWRHAVGEPLALAAALARLERFDDDLPEHLRGAVRCSARSDLWFAGLHVESVLAVLRGQEELAVDHLREALAQRGLAPSETGPPTGDLRIPPLLALDLGRLYLALGRGTSAAVIADALTAQAPARALLDGRLRLAQGRPQEALLAITGVRSAHEGSTAGARLEAHLLAAEAHDALLDADAGVRQVDADADRDTDVRRQLAHATALSRRVGGALPYWWAAPGVLRSLARSAPEQVRQIAQVLRRRGTPRPVEFVTVPDRQLVVLHRLADGLTSTQVAKEAFVSHNTVKTQIREIYRRLGVHDRAAALQRARELGLLDPIVRARLGASPSRP
ncbi:helix-turn-helix transcriptional regulator [Promicromonospora sukumoe]|uniref:helix-turn-helix transcriptional regulator n=1 Tax=Promicromonospora sukumoe TaxID=88382 RepID=UPI0003A8530D|nr:LuxR C-terminal-related transcriptional regulator [Promicromonospora sukumoe]